MKKDKMKQKIELYLTVLNHRAAKFYKHIVFMVYDFHVHLPHLH